MAIYVHITRVDECLIVVTNGVQTYILASSRRFSVCFTRCSTSKIPLSTSALPLWSKTQWSITSWRVDRFLGFEYFPRHVNREWIAISLSRIFFWNSFNIRNRDSVWYFDDSNLFAARLKNWRVFSNRSSFDPSLIKSVSPSQFNTLQTKRC